MNKIISLLKENGIFVIILSSFLVYFVLMVTTESFLITLFSSLFVAKLGEKILIK